MRRWGWCLLATTLLGCATTGKFRDRMDSWKGGSISDAIVEYGTPTGSIELPDGRVTYTWAWDGGSVTTGGYPVAISGAEYQVPATTRRVTCEWTFVTDAGGLIQAWTARGNGCRAR